MRMEKGGETIVRREPYIPVSTYEVFNALKMKVSMPNAALKDLRGMDENGSTLGSGGYRQPYRMKPHVVLIKHLLKP